MKENEVYQTTEGGQLHTYSFRTDEDTWRYMKPMFDQTAKAFWDAAVALQEAYMLTQTSDGSNVSARYYSYFAAAQRAAATYQAYKEEE